MLRFTLWRPTPNRSDPPSAKERILDAAATLFYGSGVHGTGVDRIIAEADVAKATFYKHFRAKDDLIIAWLDSSQTRWLDTAVADIESSYSEGADRLDAFFEWVETWTKSDGFHGCPYVNSAVETSFTGPETALVDDEQRRIETQLATWAAQTSVSDPAAVAAELMLLLPGVFVLALVREPSEPAGAARRAAAAILRSRGISPTRS